jgi:hypothetical protein
VVVLVGVGVIVELGVEVEVEVGAGGTGVGGSGPTVLKTKKSMLKPSSRSAKSHPARLTVSRGI